MTDEPNETEPNETEEEASENNGDDGVVIAFRALAARHTSPERDLNKKYKYSLVHFDDLRPGRTSPYIVDELIPREGVADVWGPPKSGKSFWVFDLGLHIAYGWPYRGRRVEQGPVVYCAFEGANGFGARAEAFRRTHKPNSSPWFYLLASSAKLVRDHKALIEAIDGQTKKPPTVVVLDTLNRSIDGSESKDQDMGAYLDAAQAICDEFACIVIIVHHSGVDTTRPRGHTSLTGNVVVQIAVRRDADDNVICEIEAMKDGPEGAIFASQLKPVEVGTTIEGKTLTSCAIIPIDVPATAGKGGPKLSKANKFALDLLRRLIDKEGQPAPADANLPASTRVYRQGEWRERFYESHPAEKQESKKKAYQRAVIDLVAAGFIEVWREFVWLGDGTKRDKIQNVPPHISESSQTSGQMGQTGQTGQTGQNENVPVSRDERLFDAGTGQAGRASVRTGTDGTSLYRDVPLSRLSRPGSTLEPDARPGSKEEGTTDRPPPIKSWEMDELRRRGFTPDDMFGMSPESARSIIADPEWNKLTEIYGKGQDAPPGTLCRFCKQPGKVRFFSAPNDPLTPSHKRATLSYPLHLEHCPQFFDSGMDLQGGNER